MVSDTDNILRYLYERALAESGNKQYCNFTNEDSLNCEDLWIESNKIHFALKDFGIEKFDRIILLGGNSKKTLIYLFACWKSNCIVLPLSKNTRNSYVQFVIGQFKADYYIDAEKCFIVSIATEYKDSIQSLIKPLEIDIVNH